MDVPADSVLPHLARLLLLLQDICHQGRELHRRNSALPRKDRVLRGRKPPCPGWQDKAQPPGGEEAVIPEGLPETVPLGLAVDTTAFPTHPALHVPSSSRVKGRKVVSSFRFLLKSMHRRLSFFLMPLIF